MVEDLTDEDMASLQAIVAKAGFVDALNGLCSLAYGQAQDSLASPKGSRRWCALARRLDGLVYTYRNL